MRAISPVILWLFLSFSVGCDVVRKEYDTLQHARDDGLFDRGWLPNILPESATSIRTANDLDINTSEGEFTIAIQDADAFIERLSVLEEPYAGQSDYIERMQSRGYEGFSYTDVQTWLFLCSRKTGHCTYRLPYGVLGN